MAILRLINRVLVLPTLGFGLGVGTFIRAWPNEGSGLTLGDDDAGRFQRRDVLKKIENVSQFKRLSADGSYVKTLQSDGIPAAHRPNCVGQGILFGYNKLEIDPIILKSEEKGEIVVFYHLGKDLGNENGKVHKGILSLLLDEALCYCGFPTLPSKRGVTAKLDIHFDNDIPADSTIVLKAHVTQSRGRKCIIDGTLESVPSNPVTSLVMGPTTYARAQCILVEPKWFRIFSRVDLF